jgi:hypothetical protein
VIRDAGQHLDYLYFHWFGGWNDRRTEYAALATSMYTGLIPLLDRIAQDVKNFAPSAEARARLSRILIPEWNVYGGWVKPIARGTALHGALAYSRTLHAFATRNDLVGASHLALFAPFPDPPMTPLVADIREGYFLYRGQADQPDFYGAATAAVAQLWSAAWQPDVVAATVDHGPAFDNGVSALDITALRSQSGDALSLIVTNAASAPLTLTVDLAGYAAGQEATLLTVTGDGLAANNSWRDQDRVALSRSTLVVDRAQLALAIPAYSVQAIMLKSSGG